MPRWCTPNPRNSQYSLGTCHVQHCGKFQQKIHTEYLFIATCNNSGFVTFNSSVTCALFLVCPLSVQTLHTRFGFDHSPCVMCTQGCKLFMIGALPQYFVGTAHRLAIILRVGQMRKFSLENLRDSSNDCIHHITRCWRRIHLRDSCDCIYKFTRWL